LKYFFLSLFLWANSLSFAQEVNADSLIAFAQKFIGTKYCYAQCTPKKGFDCSGFVQYVFANFNIKVPRSSMDYENAGRKVQLDSCRKGDVIVFTGTNAHKRTPGHVGIIVSNDANGIVFIHSSSGSNRIGVIMTNYTRSENYRKRFLKIVRMDAVK
jgi:cell wall-associated NlpC family hydrolase